MAVLRTPDDRFASLPDYPFAPRYVDLDGLRMHYVDEGDPSAPIVLLLHGEPSWSYLYRTMIPPLVAAGLRCVAPDLIGFGKSDKPTDRAAYTYATHMAWLHAFTEQLDLDDVTLFGQDWGGLLGLRWVAEAADRVARVVASNTGLPTGDQRMPEAFFAWQQLSQAMPELPVGGIVARGCVRPVAAEVIAAYDAPFPDESYKAGARQFPLLVPSRPDDPASEANRAAWATLKTFARPVLTLFSDNDPITRGGETFLQQAIPGCAGQPHRTIANAGHFVQEDAGPELADAIVAFVRATG
jgi:haloalkane dehalogenase